jgi:hypothetical protein
MFSLAEKRTLTELSRTIDRFVHSLEPGQLSMADATAWLADVIRMRTQLASAELVLAARVADGREWARDGDKSPAHFLARTAGVSLGEAIAKLDAAERLADLPVASEALAKGEVSEAQFRHIADAAKVAPHAERHLVDLAQRETLTGLRRECARAKAEGLNAQQLHDRAHATRRLRHRCDDDGAFVMELRTTSTAGAEVVAAIRHFQQDVFRTARTEGRREPFEAYAADALIAMARAAMSGGSGRKQAKGGSDAKVIVRVDHTALVRGHVEPGELCEITGVGPVPTSAVDDLLADGAFLAAVITNGVDVLSVAHLGRHFTAHQRTALEFRDPECTVLGCNRTDGLERDHRTDWAVTHHTKVDDGDHLCSHHHGLKTYNGWRLEPGTGKRRMISPLPDIPPAPP